MAFFVSISISAIGGPTWKADYIDLGTIREENQAAFDLNRYVAEADRSSLAFSKVNGPSWMVLSGSGELSGIPARSDVGKNQFTVQVMDDHGYRAITEVSLKVIQRREQVTCPDNNETAAKRIGFTPDRKYDIYAYAPGPKNSQLAALGEVYRAANWRCCRSKGFASARSALGVSIRERFLTRGEMTRST